MSRPAKAADLAHLKRRLASEQHLLYKLNAIRALHITAHNSPLDMQKTAVEFYYAVGDLLEGLQAEELELKNIERDEFLKELHHDD